MAAKIIPAGETHGYVSKNISLGKKIWLFAFHLIEEVCISSSSEYKLMRKKRVFVIILLKFYFTFGLLVFHSTFHKEVTEGLCKSSNDKKDQSGTELSKIKKNCLYCTFHWRKYHLN